MKQFTIYYIVSQITTAAEGEKEDIHLSLKETETTFSKGTPKVWTLNKGHGLRVGETIGIKTSEYIDSFRDRRYRVTSHQYINQPVE